MEVRDDCQILVDLWKSQHRYTDVNQFTLKLQRFLTLGVKFVTNPSLARREPKHILRKRDMQSMPSLRRNFSIKAISNISMVWPRALLPLISSQMETIVPVIVGLILIAMTYFLMSKKDTKSQIISLEDCDISKLEIKKKSVFYIGISDQAISVSENGILRGIEFSRDLYKVLKKAIAYPRSGDSYLPETVCFVNSSAAFEKDINQITKLGITIGNYKDFEVKAKRPTDAGQTASTGLLPQPNRGCFVCHKEIESKPSQCSACKAVIYCGGACAKKDWPSHKQICGNFKTSVEHIKEWDLHDFPFDFYNKDKILCNYNAVPLLNTQGKHNLGLFSRLCGCFTDIPWGELGKDILEKCQESGDPQKMFQLLGSMKLTRSRCRIISTFQTFIS